MNFKPGDYIRCLDASMVNKLTVNRTYKVIDTANNTTSSMVIINNNDYNDDWYYSYRFELDICMMRKKKLEKLYGNKGR